MKLCWFLLSAFVVSGCYVSKNPMRNEVKRLQRGITKDDTSYVYALPFEEGKSYYMVQGYFGSFTHKERAALDFKMKRGSVICAARDGVVVRVKEDGDRGGLKRRLRAYGNYVIIQHADSSRAGYWHIKKDGALVNLGDTVNRGQPIALSGKTGYSAIPHLHFLVWSTDNRRQWRQVATRFKTSKGIQYLRPLRKYKNNGN
ncbi:M23 family metallopeptidase [Terrimonas pollutisoli]|uniref:M23 family metallopeptidase n=1 Tax=Terrimonas pollutisoli TaxID=3034147 RepID=UPI0023EBE106|nr:M23 family metallopeptidase [Terrimonas sp. H1YJ31]